MPSIAFLGSGNMAGAIVDGLLAKHAATPADLVCLGGDDDTAAKLAEVLAFYDDYGRGMDGMQLPYVVSCHKAVVVDRIDETDDDASSGEGISIGGASDGTDTDMLLIDFR